MKLDIKEFVNCIKKGNFDNIYFFYGEDPFRIKEASKYIEQCLREKFENIEVIKILYDTKETSIDNIINTINTYSIFNPKQCIIFKDIPIQIISKQILPYLKKNIKNKFFVFEITESILSPKDENEIQNIGTTVFFKKIKGEELISNLRVRAKRLNLMIDDQLLEKLIERVGEDLGILNEELQKIALVIYPRNYVTIEDISKSIDQIGEFQINQLIHCLRTKNLKKAIIILEELLKNNEEPILIIGYILRFLQNQIIEQKKDYYLGEYTLNNLLNSFTKLFEIDLKIKSSSTPSDLLLFNFIFEFLYKN